MTYRARPFSDLVDEDKHGFVKRRYISTLLGGYRYVYDEVNQNTIGIGLHLAQLLIYLLSPIIFGMFGLRWIIMQMYPAAIVSGVIFFVINLVFMIIRHFVGDATDIDLSDEKPGLFSKDGVRFLVPKRGILESIWCLILSFLYGFTITLMFLDGIILKDNPYQIMCIVFSSLAGYSLFSHRCPEPAIYRDNEAEFGLGSNHYQRPLYMIIIASVNLI